MRSLNTYYTDDVGLNAFLKKHNIEDSSSLLIQVFTSKNEKEFISKLLHELTSTLPSSVIIGSTTDGEIMDANVSTQTTVLSFTQFEHTKLYSSNIEHKRDGYASGEVLAKTLIKENTKLVIAFADGLHTNGEAFLNGFNSINKDVIVSGGLAGDNAKFEKTYVFTNDVILEKGAVAVALNSECLSISNGYSFNWRSIGKELTVTKVKDNRVFTIDGRSAVDTYKHYLGDEMEERLPSVGVEFPLICVKNGVQVARAVLAKHEDGSLSFAGNLQKGDKVKFGYGDPAEILRASYDIFETLIDKPSEAIFIYSCMARRNFMPDVIETETLPLQELAPVSGFFTYGEFFTSNERKELLNQAMTVVTLSENNTNMRTKEISLPENDSNVNSSTNALIHLVNVSSKEAMEHVAMKKAQNRFETLFKKSPDGIFLIENDVFMQCNQKMMDMFGYESEVVFLSAKPSQISPRRQPNNQYSLVEMQRMKQIAYELGSHKFEWVFKKQNGEEFWTEVMLTALKIDSRDVMYLVCRDISERKAMELELSKQKNIFYYQANHDGLTGLANRTLFMKELRVGLEEMSDSKDELALMFIDLDRFKKINDSLGHDVGDNVIHIIAERLKNNIRKNDIVARLGGDEFLVLLKDIKKHDEILIEAKRLLEVIEKPMSVSYHTLYSTASIGISRYPIDDKNAENLLKYADTAMYKAKEEGGNNFQFYKREMTDTAYAHVMMEKDLREGMKNENFEVYYQPQYDNSKGKLIGMEALVRWHHPTVGLLSPDVFIPLSEKTGLIIELDLWVMQTAMREMKKWYEAGLNPGRLSLNTGMRQLENPNMIRDIVRNLKLCDFKAEWLELEVTETEMMKKPEQIISILETLHALGISIAIDDFGTGYSSLSHLKRLPVDTLKIDKSFIADIPHDEDGVSIVNTMISLAKSLNLSLVAEGVETKEQEDFLLANGCSVIQGYVYSKPLPSDKIIKLLQ